MVQLGRSAAASDQYIAVLEAVLDAVRRRAGVNTVDNGQEGAPDSECVADLAVYE